MPLAFNRKGGAKLLGIVFIYEESRCSVKNSEFLVAPWWNPAVENQAVDRSYRIGQLQAKKQAM